MQQQQQQQQQLTNQSISQASLQFQLQTQPTHIQQHLGNNIIVVRGSRNEHGEIVIQNKQDIFTFLSEHHQQQQQQQLHQQQQLQQQNEKATVATLTQLPSTTTVARKTSISLIANNVGIGTGILGNAATLPSPAATNTINTIPKETNTILLQTPINSSQLESVLLQSGQLKKSNSTATSGTDRPFLFKNSSRSLSTDSNRFGTVTTASGEDKGPFVLQTLKRLEKSQSILVIRNSSSSTGTTASGANSTSSLSNSSSSMATSLTVEHKLSLSSSSLSSSQQEQQQHHQQQPHATTVGVNTAKCTGSTITSTRTKKSHKSNASNGNSNAVTATSTKLGDVLSSATGQRHLSIASNSNNNNNNVSSKFTNATSTTTYLRLTNGNNNNNNNSNNKNNNCNNVANNNNHKKHNSSRVILNGNNSETISTSITTLQQAAGGSSPAKAGMVTTTKTLLALADVQLKHERNSPSNATSTATTGVLKTQGTDGDPIKLPDNLESLPRADSFPSQRHRWNTNEEIAAILISFDKHNEWQSKEVKTRPKSGSLLLYSRKKVRYRRDGYCWKKRKDGKTTREDHMKLKVQGTECIYGCYVHSAILPTFHRRCYWLLQNPDIVLVHYLNVPYPDDNKMAVIAPSISLWGDKKEWTKEELVSQLKPMLSTVTSDDESDSGNDIEISTAETVESIVCQLMEKQRLSRQAALVKQLDCGCGDASCADGKTCTHPVMRRPNLIKANHEKRLPATTSVEPYNANNTPNVVVGPKLYSRWADKRSIRESSNSMDNSGAYQHHHGHGHHGQTQQLTQESAIKFQIIPPHSEPQSLQQQQHYRHNYNANGVSNSTAGAVANHHQLVATRNNLIMQHHHQQQQQQMHTNQSNFNQVHNSNNNNTNHNLNNNNNNNNLQRYPGNNDNAAVPSHQQQQHRFQIAKTTITAMDNNTNNQQHHSNNSTSINNGEGSNTSGSAGGGEITVDLLNSLAHSHQNIHQQMSTTNSNTNNKTNHNTNITSSNNNSNNSNGNHNTTSQNSQHSNQTIPTTCSTSVAVKTNSEQLMSTSHQQHHHQQNDLNVVNNNNNTTTKYNNYNQQQLNASNNNSNNNNSLNSHTANQQKHSVPQQEQYYKMQHHKQQQHQQQQQSSSVAASSTVEPMCMSPEHQRSPPQIQLKQQQQQNNLIISSSDSITVSSSSLSPLSSQTFTNVNQKSTSSAIVNSNCNNNSSRSSSAENEETSSARNDLSINTSNINNNVSSNRNNQLDEYNNCSINNKTIIGCAISSSDASNSDKNSSMSPGQQSLNSNVKSKSNHTDNLQLIHTAPTSNSSTICFDNLEQSHLDGNQTQMHSHPQHTQKARHASSDLHDTLSFFNETLDLSHEDIQRTLIANMPGEGALLTSLDFMNSSAATAVNNGVLQREQCEPDNELSGGAEADDEDTDDVFANLDAFDMLVEFPELDLDDKQALTNTALEQAVSGAAISDTLSINSSCQNLHQLTQFESGSTSALSCNKKILKICDFSPDWSYPEGGVKVLVAGPWTSDAQYTVLFDSHPVPTVLVQEGVLRCYCPSHEVGYATLQVSCDGFVISDSVMFEYKMMSCQEAPFDASTNDCLYKFSLYNRLTTIEEIMETKGETVTVSASQQIFSLQGNLEEKLVGYCNQLMRMCWNANGASSNSSWNTCYKGMTLLHLAAALGYNKLVCALLNWRTENPHIILETEIDAFSQDSHGYTPLTWACSRGHIDSAVVLYKWNQNALKIKNYAQQTPLDVAHKKGHKNVVAEIYRLENERQRRQNKGSLTSLSINLNKYALTNEESDEHSSFAIFESSDSQRSHDGVFLRPVALASNQSPPNCSRFSKRSSIDSGISMDIRTKPIKSFKDTARLHSVDAHDNYNGSIESPLDAIGTATNSLLSPLRKMDFALCEVSTGDSSPLPDKSNDDDTLTIDNDDGTDDVTIPNKNIDAVVGDSDAKVLTLAEHIIAAMPARIKNEADEMMVLGSPMTEPLNSESTGLNDSFMDPLLDSLPNAHFDNEFNFDFNDLNYRYHEVSTPCSSLSPASSAPLQSPASYSILGHDPSVSSPSPPPSTKQLTEFLHASSNAQYPFEADFSKLTLTDTEQRELYEAAKCIQKAYRSYKGRQKLEEQNKERTAAIVIQNYYRRYKQFAYYRQMTNAALVIQHSYRSYCRNKRFKKSQTTNHLSEGLHNTDSQDSTNSQCLSSFFDSFNKQETENSPQICATPKETSPSGPLKRTYSQSTQNQAARKIQQFMRQSRIKLQKERAEKERLVHQRREEYLQNLQYQGQLEIVCPIVRSDTTAKDCNELGTNDLLTNNQS